MLRQTIRIRIRWEKHILRTLVWVSVRAKVNAEHGLMAVNDFFTEWSHQVRPAQNAETFGQLNIITSK